MKKSHRSINFNYDDEGVYQEEAYWDENLSEEDTKHTEKGTRREEPRSKTARKKARKTTQKINGDESFED